MNQTTATATRGISAMRKLQRIAGNLFFTLAITLTTLSQGSLLKAEEQFPPTLDEKATVLLFKNFDQIDLKISATEEHPTPGIVKFSKLLARDMSLRGARCDYRFICTFKMFKVREFESGTQLEEAIITFQVDKNTTFFSLLSATFNVEKR